MMCPDTQRKNKKGARKRAPVDELDKREWWWLNGALHAIAQVSSGDPGAYWKMLTQKRAVDRKRVEIATRIGALVGPPPRRG